MKANQKQYRYLRNQMKERRQSEAYFRRTTTLLASLTEIQKQYIFSIIYILNRLYSC